MSTAMVSFSTSYQVLTLNRSVDGFRPTILFLHLRNLNAFELGQCVAVSMLYTNYRHPNNPNSLILTVLLQGHFSIFHLTFVKPKAEMVFT